jgi:putative oxidoreductase
MNVLLWVLQIALAIYFFFTGIIHFSPPPGLPQPMAWMYDLSAPLHYISGAAEILAAIGLVLPSVTRIQPRLTPLAAMGLVVVMLLAAVFHLLRGEFPNIIMNLLLAAVAGFVAYGRTRLKPIPPR